MATYTDEPITFHRLHVPPLRRRVAARWSWWLIAAALLGVGIPLVVAAITGNLSIPHNDSWAASKIAETFARTGQIKFVNWNQMSLVGQAVMLGPLGTSIVNQQTAVAVLAVILLYCAYDLVSDTLPTGRAAFSTLIVAIWPGFALLATSFMTDVPEMAAAFASLSLGRYALKRDSPALLYASMLVAFWGTTIREEAIIAPISVVIYGLISQTSRARLRARRLLGASGAFVVLLLIFLVWRSRLPEANNPDLVTGTISHILLRIKLNAPQLYFTLAFCISPAVLLTARPWRWPKRSWWLAGLVLLEAYNLGLTTTGGGFLTGNYFDRQGAYFAVLSGTRQVFGNGPMIAVTDVSAISGALLAGTLGEGWRWRRLDPVLTLFTGLTALALLAFVVNGLGVFDRYIVALIPGVLAIVLADESTRVRSAVADKSRLTIKPPRWTNRVLAGGALVFVGTMSTLVAANAFSFDIARWHAGEKLVQMTGLRADQIDAGLEWLGTYTSAPVRYTPSTDHVHLGQEGLWYRHATCVNLATSPPPPGTHWVQIRMFPYRTFLLSGRSYLYAYYTDQPGKRRRHATGCKPLNIPT